MEAVLAGRNDSSRAALPGQGETTLETSGEDVKTTLGTSVISRRFPRTIFQSVRAVYAKG